MLVSLASNIVDLNEGTFSCTQKIASKSGLKNPKIENETFSTKNSAVLTYKSQNAYISRSYLLL